VQERPEGEHDHDRCGTRGRHRDADADGLTRAAADMAAAGVTNGSVHTFV
jgi:hypothetical protein